MTKIAKVVLPISLDKEFDYYFQESLGLKQGMRVLVDFRNRKRTGIVTRICEKTKTKNLKPIIERLDNRPSLSQENIDFAIQLSKIYPYHWGEFLFMMLPSSLKLKRKIEVPFSETLNSRPKPSQKVFIKADEFASRYQSWKGLVKENLRQGSVLICFPQMSYLLAAKKLIEKDFKQRIFIIHSQGKNLIDNWKNSKSNALILGTRVALFYYPWDLSLLVLEDENNPYYFQEEKPFYHALDVALLLSKIKNINLALSGNYPSMAAYDLIQNKEITIKEKTEDIKPISLVEIPKHSKSRILSPVLIELLRKTLYSGERSIVIWNKKGFSRVISCSNCGYVLKCDRCSGFLRVSLESKEGICPYCECKVVLPEICSECSKGYFKKIGYGVQRLEISLKQTFPEAVISDWKKHSSHSQIITSTSKILGSIYEHEKFDRGFILDIDYSLAQGDYNATLDAFIYLKKLSLFFKDRLHVFTKNPSYYLFEYINKPWIEFYVHELEIRRKLRLPPFGVVAKITLRAKNENTVLKKANELYNNLIAKKQQVHGPFKERPFKLRDKFRYSLIVKSKDTLFFRKIIKKVADQARTSSIQLAVSLQLG